MVTLHQALGICHSQINYSTFNVPVNKHSIAVLQQLKGDAKRAGFDLDFASGYRSFDRQKTIWNAKAAGLRAVLDHHGNPICFDGLPSDQLLRCILYWSALPGTSRHHWGTEVDIYDKAALGKQKLELTIKETVAGGVFEEMYLWLNEYLLCQTELRRPYIGGAGRVANEPWHISVVDAAKPYEAILAQETVKNFVLSATDMGLYNEIVTHFDEIYAHYVAPYFLER